jgi:hypothetical protein
MSRTEAIFPAVFMVAVAALLAAGFLVFDYSWSVIAFPLGAGAALCVLCAIELLRILAGRNTVKPGAAESAVEPLSLPSLAWMFSLAVFLWGLGCVIGPALYLLVYLRLNGSSWAIAIGVAIGSLVLTWGIFIKVLGILLPVQPLWMG